MGGGRTSSETEKMASAALEGGAESPQLLVGNSFQGHIETVLVVQAMPANGSDLTVRTDQKLDVAHVLGEAHVLKDEHVVNQPVFLEEITVRIAAISQGWLLSHGGEEKLRQERQHKACESWTGSGHIFTPSLPLTLTPSSFRDWEKIKIK